MPEQSIVDFLLARIAEDEALASGAGNAFFGHEAAPWDAYESVHHNWKVCDSEDTLEITADAAIGSQWIARHIANWDPPRVLADCASKRAIIERYQTCVFENERNSAQFAAWEAAGGTEYGDGSIPDATEEERARKTFPFEKEGLRLAVHFLAAPFSDHADYQTSLERRMRRKSIYTDEPPPPTPENPRDRIWRERNELFETLGGFKQEDMDAPMVPAACVFCGCLVSRQFVSKHRERCQP